MDIFCVLFFSQGLWLSIVRIFEPSYLPTLRWYLKNKLFRCKGSPAQGPSPENLKLWERIEALTSEVSALETLTTTVDEDVECEDVDDQDSAETERAIKEKREEIVSLQ